MLISLYNPMAKLGIINLLLLKEAKILHKSNNVLFLEWDNAQLLDFCLIINTSFIEEYYMKCSVAKERSSYDIVWHWIYDIEFPLLRYSWKYF